MCLWVAWWYFPETPERIDISEECDSEGREMKPIENGGDNDESDDNKSVQITNEKSDTEEI